MKVVINQCYGGFNPSGELLKRLLLCDAACLEECDYNKTGMSEPDENGISTHRIYPFVSRDGKSYALSDELEYRIDSDLVRLVEELGSDASGSSSKLVVEEIPKGHIARIRCHDGYESLELSYIDEDCFINN